MILLYNVLNKSTAFCQTFYNYFLRANDVTSTRARARAQRTHALTSHCRLSPTRAHLHTRTLIHARTRARTRTLTRLLTFTYAHARAHARTRSYLLSFTHAYAHFTRTHARTHALTRSSTQHFLTHARTRTHTRAYAHLSFKAEICISFRALYFFFKKSLETFSHGPKYNDLLLTRQNHFTLRYNFSGLYKALKLFNLNVLFPLFVQSAEAEIVRPGASRRRRSTRSSSFFRASVLFYEQRKK